MKKIYYYRTVAANGAVVEGVFVATEDTINNMIGKTIYVGNLIPGYVDTEVIFERKDVSILTESERIVGSISGICHTNGTFWGINPLVHLNK